MKHDFILHPLSGEPSCREYILPFKPVTVKVGEIIIGRPTFQGCPVTHVMKVIEQDKFGLIGVWMVGPQKSRGTFAVRGKFKARARERVRALMG